MAMAIQDRFTGYIEIDNNLFAFSFQDQIVELLPTDQDYSSRKQSVDEVVERSVNLPEFIYGHDGEANIALMRTEDFYKNHLGIIPRLWFSPPLIIKAAGNTETFRKQLSADWNSFHSIVFSGGNLNSLVSSLNQSVIISCENENKQITIGNMDPLYQIKCCINDIDTEISISIVQSGQSYDAETNSFMLGKLSVHMRFSFCQPQSFHSIPRYYKIAKSIVAFLTRQNNVTFGISLSQRNDEGKYVSTAICRAYDGYENYAKTNRFQAISFAYISEQLQNLITVIEKENFESLFSILPNDNREKSFLTIRKVQDLCTALEVAYKWKQSPENKDLLIEDLKNEIIRSIKSFRNNHPGFDAFKETTVSSCFQYMDLTLAEKIWTLYNEYKEVVDQVSQKKSLNLLTREDISAFVKMRNSRTHNGIFTWGNQAAVYPVLFALVYSCALDHIGVPRETIQRIIYNVF